MKIINKGVFYFGTDGTAYRGTIELLQEEFYRAMACIYRDNDNLDLFTKDILKRDLDQRKYYKDYMLCALRVTITDYIVAMFENTSRYNYKRQNYIIKVK